MTKLNLLLSLLITLTLSSCLKNKNSASCPYSSPTAVATAQEITNIQNYLTQQSLTATQHSSGIFYNITTAGTGESVSSQCNTVGVRYVGKLTTGSQFDASTNPVQFPLYNLISGWRIGIPLTKVGGSIKLYIPPSLGYGSQAQQGIPANSILVFDIDLVTITK